MWCQTDIPAEEGTIQTLSLCYCWKVKLAVGTADPDVHKEYVASFLPSLVKGFAIPSVGVRRVSQGFNSNHSAALICLNC